MKEELITQIEVLKSLLPVYSGKTIDNIVRQLESRTKYL